MKHRFSACWSDELGKAILAECTEPYTMSLVHEDAKACQEAVNQGIDSCLEACFCPDKGDTFDLIQTPVCSKLYCVVSPESLRVLVRRLLESGDDTGLASDICETLDIELI